MAFPGFKRTREFSSRSPQQYPSAAGEFGIGYSASDDPNVMTYKGTINRTLISFAVLIVGAVIGWSVPALVIPAVIAGLVLGLVIAFKQIRNPIATLAYSLTQGVLVGAISMSLESYYEGIVAQAVLATLAVFITVMVLTRMNVLRTSPRLNKIFFYAAIGYLVFCLLNLVMMLVGAFPADSMFGMRSGWFGVVIGIIAVALASYSLVTDLEFVENGVRNRIEKSWEWFASFSLIATLVWLYVEILRIIAIFRN